MKRKAKNGTEFYAVSWAEYDPDEDTMSSGLLSNIYPTYEAARQEIQNCLVATAQDALDAFDEDEREKIFGTTDAEVLARQSIRDEKNGFVASKHPNYEIEYQYSIRKYSTEFMETPEIT